MRTLAAAVLIACPLLAGGAPEAMPGPKLTPHHEALKALEGTWDAEIHMDMGPGKPEQVSKGVESVKAVCGGLWIQVDFRSESGGMPMEGHGLFGYDTAARKHVGTWVDGMVSSMSVSTGRCDGQCKRLVSTFRGSDPSGKAVDYKELMQLQDPDHRTEEMSVKVKGRFVKVMTILYTRRK